MKSLTKFYLIAFCLSLLLADCNKPADDDVIITYQHLGNAQTWNLNDQPGQDKNGMWHVYMLRGIVNKGKEAKPFFFNIDNLNTENGKNVNSPGNQAGTNAGQLSPPRILPLDFTVTVKPQEAYTVPLGNPVLFIIKQDNDTEQTPVTRLFYKPKGPDGKTRKIQEGVIMHMLDTKPVTFGHLDVDFLEQMRTIQNEYEHDYEPGGGKK
jgi:hypothetical protein